ncbi:ADP-ribose glycohydrolase OARD1 [Frankliniella fusca]|uniref:RNA-directed DNA polymerase n=1 Tax=Frankliniella fusca TaxID=407009 RepID=A0AAE1HWT0_9NEOP|nr:ADP-ribose glycohydrolase OARD1 [Frankliniella fusca]
MGAGIAKLFRKRFGKQNFLKSLKKKPGDVAALQDNGRFVFYLVTKPKYFQKPNPRDLLNSLLSLKNFCLKYGINNLSMPKISTGLDQLSWDWTVRPMLARVFAHSKIKINVFTPRDQKTTWSEDNLKRLLLTLLLRHWNRGYRNIIQKEFGSFRRYAHFLWSQEFFPTEIEIRLWAEYFFRRIPVRIGGREVIVGCYKAPITPTIELVKTEENKRTVTKNPEREEAMHNPREVKRQYRTHFQQEEKEEEKPEDDERNVIVQHIHSVLKLKNSNLFSVPMTIHGVEQRVTVDTAASKSLISVELIQNLPLLPSKYCLMSASDGELSLLGECKINCEADGQTFEHTMLVHNQNAPALRVLLGNDFHDKYKSNVCFLRNQFTIPSPEGVIVLSRLEKPVESEIICACIQEENDSHDCPIQVISKKEIRVPPRENVKIKVTFSPQKPTTRSYFEPRGVMNGVLVGWDMLVDPDDDAIWVTNISDKEVLVMPGLKFGFLRNDLQVRAPKKGRTKTLLQYLSNQFTPRLVGNIFNFQEGEPADEEFDINPELPEEERKAIRAMLHKNADVFMKENEPLRTTSIMKVRLPLKDDGKVIYQHNYSLSPVQDKAASEVIQRMLQERVLEPAPHSNYRIPFFLVEKGKDKNDVMQYRLVLSAKKLNECFANINYAPPKIPHILAQLKGKTLFSTLDLSSSFHQLEIDERDRHILTIQHKGQLFRYRHYRTFIKDFHKISKPVLDAADPKAKFEWGPEQKKAVTTLHKMLIDNVALMHFDPERETIVTVDGSPVYGCGAVLLQKCPKTRKFRPVSIHSKQFPKSQRNMSAHDAELLALYYALQKFRMELHAVHSFEIHSDCNGLQHLNALPHPSSRQARVMLYLSQFHGKYKIKHKPGREQVCPDFHSRNPDPIPSYDPHDEEFDSWKLPDEDARNPIMFKKLEQKSIELLGSKQDTSITAKYLKDLAAGMEQDLEREGLYAVTRGQKKREEIEDSRRARKLEPPGLPEHTPAEWATKLEREQRMDNSLLPVITAINNGEEQHGYVLRNGLLCRAFQRRKTRQSPDMKTELRICIPVSLRKDVLRVCHDSIFGNHYGVKKTLTLIKGTYHWDRMEKDTRNYIASCDKCSKFKPKLTKAGLLQPVKSYRPFQKMACDFAEYVKSTSGNRYALVVVDLFSSYIYAVPTKRRRTVDAIKAFKQILQYIVTPDILICDAGSHFTSDEFRSFVIKLGIRELHVAPTDVHFCNGAAEAAIKKINESIRIYCEKDINKWEEALPYVLNTINGSVLRHGKSPAELLYGVQRTVPGSPCVDEETEMEVSEFEKRRDETREEILKKKEKLQESQKKTYDRNRHEENYKPNQKIYYLVQRKARFDYPAKLQEKFRLGTVLAQEGPVTYLVRPEEGKYRKPVRVHVSQIKPFIERDRNLT